MTKRRREVETTDYLAMVRRLLRTAGQRVGNADEIELADLVAMRDDLEQAIADAVAIQRTWGRSWADIGRGLGTSRQAAQQHYGKDMAS